VPQGSIVGTFQRAEDGAVRLGVRVFCRLSSDLFFKAFSGLFV